MAGGKTFLERHFGDDGTDCAQKRGWQQEHNRNVQKDSGGPVEIPQPRPVANKGVETNDNKAGDGAKGEQNREGFYGFEAVGQTSADVITDGDTCQDYADYARPGVKR